MKTVTLLTLLCALMSTFIVGEENKITHSVAHDWNEVKPFKDTVYMPFFENSGYKKEYLETRWIALKKFYKKQIARIILLKKDQKPIGFLTVESKDENVLLYTSPMLINRQKIDSVVFNVMQDLDPKLTTAYCMAAEENQPLQSFLTELGWKQVENSPIQPNEDFIKDISFIFFYRGIENSK